MRSTVVLGARERMLSRQLSLYLSSSSSREREGARERVYVDAEAQGDKDLMTRLVLHGYA
jgi:hypothetical protein